MGAAARRARLRPGQSVVTLIGSDAPLSISDHRSRTPEDLAWRAGLGGGEPVEHQLVAAGGAVGVRDLPRARRDVPRRRMDQTAPRRVMFDAVHKPAGELRRGEHDPRRRARRPDAEQVPKWASPEAIVLIVAGGEAGRYSAVLAPAPAWGRRSSPGRWRCDT